MSLQNAQAELVDLILNEHTVTNTIFPAENLIIYRDQINHALINTLKDTYPLILKLLGEDFFRIAVKEYIQHYPSRSSNVQEYGEYFSRFLAHYPPVKNLIYLVEVAEFEWLCHSLYFAADHSGLDHSRPQTFPVEQYEHLHFSLHPAARVVKFHYPMLAIVELCKHHTETQINLNAGAVNLLIIRPELELMLMRLDNADFAFLDALQEGLSVAEALQKALLYAPEFNLEAKLPQWIQDRTIVDYL